MWAQNSVPEFIYAATVRYWTISISAQPFLKGFSQTCFRLLVTFQVIIRVPIDETHGTTGQQDVRSDCIAYVRVFLNDILGQEPLVEHGQRDCVVVVVRVQVGYVGVEQLGVELQENVSDLRARQIKNVYHFEAVVAQVPALAVCRTLWCHLCVWNALFEIVERGQVLAQQRQHFEHVIVADDLQAFVVCTSKV